MPGLLGVIAMTLWIFATLLLAGFSLFVTFDAETARGRRWVGIFGLPLFIAAIVSGYYWVNVGMHVYGWRA